MKTPPLRHRDRPFHLPARRRLLNSWHTPHQKVDFSAVKIRNFHGVENFFHTVENFTRQAIGDMVEENQRFSRCIECKYSFKH
jgi:hypothetical protein